MAKRKTITFKVGRNASSGRFVKVSHAKKYKRTNVVETIKRKA